MKHMHALLCGSLLAVLFLGGVCLESRAQVPTKKFKIEYRDQPWDKVLEWLADQTGMPLISTLRPTGTVNFIAPRDANGQPREYTLPEVIDILNELMQAQKYHLLRRQASYTIVSADEKIPPELVMRVNRDDLKHFGKTEIVSLVQPLEVFNADEFAPEVKKMMGPFGEVVIISRANALLLQDTVGNLNVILKFIDDTEKNEKVAAQTYVHKCIWIRAKEAEAKLREAIGETKEEVQIKTGDQSRPSFFGRPSQEAPKPTFRTRITTISSDERTNQVFVSGPADKIARAKEILKRLDVQQPPQEKPLPQGSPFIKYHQVPGGADNFVKTLNEIHKTSTNFKFWVVNPTTIGVYGGPAEHAEIELQISHFPKVTSVTEKISLSSLDATKTAETLKGIFPDSKLGSPYIEADTLTNSLIIKGSKEQLADVKNVINALGEVQGTGTMRIIGLDKGSAVTLAEALERLLPQLRANPVRIILPGQDTGSESKKKPDLKPVLPNDCGPSEQQQNGAKPAEKRNGQPQLIDPQKKNGNGKKQTKLPGDPKAPVTVMAFGNKLIVTSEDPAALALVSEVVRLLTQTQAGEGDFAVIRLRYANAVEAAKVLDQVFNGTRSQGRGQGGGPPDIGRIIEGLNPMNFLSRFSAPGAQAPGTPTPERIRVVADPQTNSLLIKATPLDLLTIRSLLDKAIDNNETESEAVIRTWVIGPLKHCNATELAGLIASVYRENMNNNPRGFGAMTSFSPFGGGSRSASPNTNDRVTLSLGVDERTNSLVVACPTAMYEDIKNLVAQMEKAAADSTTTIKVIPLKGIDPALVEQAINAVAGRSSTSSTSGFRRPGDSFTPGGSSFTPGGFPPGGFTPGGFSPGGFSPGGFSPGGFSPGGFQRPFTFPTSGGMDGGGGRSGRTFGPGGGGRTRGRGDGDQSRGPDFFGHTVKDDQPTFVLYDPQHPLADLSAHASLIGSSEEQQISGTQPGLAQPGTEGPPLPGTAGSEALRGPRTTVTAEALEQLGVIILRGNNKADVEEIVRVIEYIQRLGSAADVQIELVPLQHGDATSVAALLTQLFSRVVIGPTSTVLVAGGAQRPAAVPVTPGPTPAAPGQQPPQQPVAAAPVSTGSIVLLPVPRLNAILLAAPRSRIDDMRREIARLDVATTARAVPFPLQRASATRVATLISQFYGQRYPNETSAQNHVRVTYDDGTNTVFVQASPADLAEIRELITRIDTTSPSAKSDLRIVRLNNAVADELAAILTRAISEGTTVTTAAAPGIFPQQPTGLLPGQPGVGPAQFGQPGVTGVTARPGLVTKTSALRFFTTRGDNGKPVETGILEDVRINTDPRTNSLLIAAPEKTMQLILALIRDLDVPPAARAEINIFTLKKADAQSVAATLQQLFLGTGAAGAQARPGGQVIPGTQQVAIPGQTGQLGTTAGRPLQLTIGDRTPEGAPLIDLRLSVDPLTNSIIVAGSRNDLDVIEAIIARLEDFDPQQQRRSEAYRLKNAIAADVALAVNDFLTKQLQVYSKGGVLTTFQELLREVVVVAEPISNTLLVSATPRYFDEVIRLICALDQLPPQVVIQALIAEVTFNDTDEFGVEWGLQSPVLFDRSVLPAGVTVANSVDAAIPGFNFINTAPLGQATLTATPTVGFQGINQLGVGRVSPTQGVGGFVFSAASDSINILVRALKVQGRLDVLSRPQIMTADNQAARIHVGQDFPYITGSTITTGVTGVPTVANSIDYKPIGVQLTVTPKINPDGTVIMRVIPALSSVSPTTVDFGNNVFASAFNIQTVETTVIAQDGETVAIGGLITRREQKQENRIPWLGDLPGVGALFRFRQHNKGKTELIVILTPHIVRCKADADRILAEEARRMDWILGDVTRVHGVTGMEPVLHGPVVPHPGPSLAPYGILPPTPIPGVPVAPATGEPLPAPRPLPGTPLLSPAPMQNSKAAAAFPAAPSSPGRTEVEGGQAASLTPSPGSTMVPAINPAVQPLPASNSPLQPALPRQPSGSGSLTVPPGTPTAVATPVMSSPVNHQQGRESQAWLPFRRN